MASHSTLQQDYPWIQAPLITSAPMRLISLAPLAVEVSKAGGLGFIGSGNDQSTLETLLTHAQSLCESSGLPTEPLAIGVGFLNWGADLSITLPLLQHFRPAAVWFFAPPDMETLATWTQKTREVTAGATKIWIQVGGVVEAVSVAEICEPDVLVVQGIDAGGHGLNQGAGIISLVPEVVDALQNLFRKGTIKEVPTIIAAGGISDGRGVAAAMALGAEGVCLGTRYLAAKEAEIAPGYRNEVLRARDGGQTTIRSSVYDTLRGTTDWPKIYGGRGVINQSYHDAVSGMDLEENKRLYGEAVKMGDKGWGLQGRMTTYAGTAVGLITSEQSAEEITKEIRYETREILRRLKETEL